ncbi:MAG TPA: hypothetical protein VJH92_02295 [Candidatus Nanoarchaeia archaeon]|nr:hypothetical protein [Candidatus Nanoarchaeia archaeon]
MTSTLVSSLGADLIKEEVRRFEGRFKQADGRYIMELHEGEREFTLVDESLFSKAEECFDKFVEKIKEQYGVNLLDYKPSISNDGRQGIDLYLDKKGRKIEVGYILNVDVNGAARYTFENTKNEIKSGDLN